MYDFTGKYAVSDEARIKINLPLFVKIHTFSNIYDLLCLYTVIMCLCACECTHIELVLMLRFILMVCHVLAWLLCNQVRTTWTPQ